MFDNADGLFDSIEAAGAGQEQCLHEAGAGQEQILHEAGAGEEQTLHEARAGEEQLLDEARAGEEQLLDEAGAGQEGEGSKRPPFNDQISNFMDSDDVELLSWLQYPLDDGVLQQLPPLSTSPVPPDFFSPSSSLPPFSSSSGSSSSSLAAVRHFPQLQDEAFMVSKTQFDRRAAAFEWPLPKADGESEFCQGEQTLMFENQETVVDYQRDMFGPIEKHHGVSQGENTNDERSKAEGWASRMLNIKQGFAKESVSKTVDVRTRPKKEADFPTSTERLQAHSHGNAALALGAGRAAGISRPAGVEAFSKVRTSLQSIQPYSSPLGSPSSFSFPLTRTPSGKSLDLVASTSTTALSALGSSAYQPSSQRMNDMKVHDLAPLYNSNLFAGFSNLNSEKNQSGDKRNKGNFSMSSAQLSYAKPSMRVPLSNPKKEELKERAINSTLLDSRFASKSDTTDMQKLSGGSLLSQERVITVSSGGSQTSGSLRETTSGSKRKLEEVEGQSEEAEGESGVSSQARTSTSKSPRTIEVHNLSERRRRNRINDKMNALRELIPNASKSNKAALLDEAIDYLKNLQLQLQVLSSRTGMSLMPAAPVMPHRQIPHYNSFDAMGVGSDMAGGSARAAGGSSTMGTMGSMHTSGIAAPYHNLQPLSTWPARVDVTALQSSAVGHLQALSSGQAHLPLYVQPSHQMVAQASSPMYTYQGIIEHPHHQHHHQQNQHLHHQQQQLQEQLQQHLHINKRHKYSH